MTSPQLEPSAHAPCTSTTLRACAGLAACADASAAKSIAVAESIPTVNAAHFDSVFICPAPVRCVVLPCFQFLHRRRLSGVRLRPPAGDFTVPGGVVVFSPASGLGSASSRAGCERLCSFLEIVVSDE